MTESDPYAFDTEALFDPACYHRFYSLTAERSDAEVTFISDMLQLEKPMRILDLACGHGRHANRLAHMGHQVTGLDASSAFLDEARTEAASMGVNVEYIQADMRSFERKNAFDLVICLFTAFGYFTDPENAQVVARVAHGLAPGGRFLLDIINRDRLMHVFRDLNVVEVDQDIMIDRSRLDMSSGRTITKRTYIIGNRRCEATFSVRLYHLQEISSLFSQMGLQVKQVWGDWKGAALSRESPRLIIVGQKNLIS